MIVKEKQVLLRAGIILLILLSVYFFLKLRELWNPLWLMAEAIFIPFIVSAFITYLLHPIIERIHRTGLPRSVSIFIIYILFFGSIGYGFYRGIPVLIKQLMELSGNIPQLMGIYEKWLTMIRDHTDHWPDGIHDRIEGLVAKAEEWLAQLIDRLIESIQALFNYMVILTLIPFLVFYMLRDVDQIKKTAWYLTPKRWRMQAKEFIRDADHSLGDYIRGQFFVCVIIGLLAFIGFFFFKVQYALILGLIIGVTNVIPYFGPIIGAIPALIIAASMGTNTVIVVVILIMVLQFIEANILGPFIVGRSLHMHPIIIMLALAAGGELGGVLGLILAVPVTAILKVVVEHGIRVIRQH